MGSQYDTNNNKTRDLEALALRKCLKDISFDNCLEIGCGTGKNTEWFIQKAKRVTAVDFSDEMLAKAKEKITSDKVLFKQADILYPWTFKTGLYDLVSFSLILEHIEKLDPVFKEVDSSLIEGGYVTEQRFVGRAKISSTVIGLLFHSAEHTMRHVGQFYVTAKIIKEGLKNGL